MQKITITGRLVRDAEIRANKNGTQFVSVRIASNYKTSNGEETVYFTATNDNTGQQPYLTKGRKVCVTGNFRYSAKSENNQTFVNLYITKSEIEFLDSRQDNEESKTDQQVNESVADDMVDKFSVDF